MKKNKIIITGFDIGGFGGMETVFNTFHNLLSTHENTEVLFVFFEKKNNICNHEWLENRKFIILKSKINNNKLKRLYYSYKLSKLIKKYKPNNVITYDTIGCYICHWARRMSLMKFPIYSWNHFSLHNMYKIKYLLLADKHLAISSGIEKQLFSIGIEKEKIYTIYNPIIRKDEIISRNEEINFLYMGRVQFSGQKNISELFTALSKTIGKYQLHIVGSGDKDEIEKLKSLAIKLNINENITWHGWQKSPWEYVKNNIKYITSLVLTSNYEGFPMVLCEALSYGIYSISSNCKTGPEDIILNDINGRLYQQNNIAELTSILQSVIDNNELPENKKIKDSIDLFYDNNYIKKVSSILK
ncbi:glycosyltransferase [Proteus penneri]|uniref:glycosyltransferase n=1 Tax=Proteus penneri TaxID=102862 RepID=UPI000E08A579|nr:glycosyltransferase [Proteus penneri]SUB98689.1 lipopolysaccharide core biosynthesis glycosyl transferase [Proteus penneri]